VSAPQSHLQRKLNQVIFPQSQNEKVKSSGGMVARRRVMESAAIEDKENRHTSSTIGFSRHIIKDGKDQNPFEIS
jgi:hypothetical protein